MTRHNDAIEKAAEAMDKNFNPDRHPIMAAMFRDYARAAVDAYEAHMRPEITTPAELDALPVGTLIRSNHGDVWEVTREGGQRWKAIGHAYPTYSRLIPRPARVVHWGDA